MPTYNFRNKETGEILEKWMSLRDRESFLNDNPEMEPVIVDAPMLGDSVRLGMRKPDDGFREVLHKIAERNPKSNLKNKLSRN